METIARIRTVCLVCCLGALLALGCKAKPADPAAVEPAAQAAPLAEMGVVAVAVAPFTQVFSETELLFGEVPPGSETAPAASLHALDTNLRAAMRSPAPSDRVPVCMASVPVTGTRALDRWVQIGSCAGVRHLLVPQVAYWAERHGGPMGSDRPAGVVLDFFVVDVQEHSIVGHYRYAESQVPLSANLLTMDKFLARKGQFVLATDLGREGVQQAMKRMGL